MAPARPRKISPRALRLPKANSAFGADLLGPGWPGHEARRGDCERPPAHVGDHRLFRMFAVAAQHDMAALGRALALWADAPRLATLEEEVKALEAALQ
eukprot:1004688-Heterocapsa_arctica.AAC.1